MINEKTDSYLEIKRSSHKNQAGEVTFWYHSIFDRDTGEESCVGGCVPYAAYQEGMATLRKTGYARIEGKRDALELEGSPVVNRIKLKGEEYGNTKVMSGITCAITIDELVTAVD